MIKDRELFYKEGYLESWKHRIQDLENILNSRLYSPGSTALLLATCYFEALGKLLLYAENSSKYPGPKKIFVETMRRFDISSANAEKVYIHFRCDFVHSGPVNRSDTIKDIHGNDVTIDIEWFISRLNDLLDKEVRPVYEKLPF